MKLRITIGTTIGIGFGVLILLFILINMETLSTLDESKKINKEIVEVHSPSVDALQTIKILILNSKKLINDVSRIESSKSSKPILLNLMEEDWPYRQEHLLELSDNWENGEVQLLQEIFEEVRILFEQYTIITSTLSNFESYEDLETKWMIDFMLVDGGDIDLQSGKVVQLLSDLIKIQRQNTANDTEKMIRSFDNLTSIVRNMGIALIIGGLLIATFTVRSIVKPVKKLREQLILLGKGIAPKEKLKKRQDEIGDMSEALNSLVQGFERTTKFAKEIGSGNFSSSYQPLSEQDALGHSLIHMRNDLSDLTKNLEGKVLERTQKIGEQKKEIEVLLKHTTDSIIYAKRIQEAILPAHGYIKKLLPKSFFLYKPKDIVSGDFYWVYERDDIVFFAAIDCTGHGVPGAFMTIIGHNGLSRSVNRLTKLTPASILDALNQEISATFRQQGGSGISDGMDAAVCAIDKKNMKLQFAGAFNPLYLIRNNEMQEVKGDKFPIGEFMDNTQKFTNHELDLIAGDSIYIFSDGFADQFGGPRGKKYRYRQFRNLLLEVNRKDMTDQKIILNKNIEEWKGDLEQVDDIIVIGVKV